MFSLSMDMQLNNYICQLDNTKSLHKQSEEVIQNIINFLKTYIKYNENANNRRIHKSH